MGRLHTLYRDREKCVCVLPLLILCFSPDRIPGVSITLMLSRTGLGSCAQTNLGKREEQRL